MSMRTPIVVALVALLLVGCVSVDQLSEREAVLGQAATRGVPAALPVEVIGALDEDTAVAVAVSRNARLSAELANVGLARSNWVSAILPPNLIAELTYFNPEGSGAILDADIRAPIAALVGWPQRRAAARASYEAAQTRAIIRTIDFAAETRLAWVEAVATRERANMYDRILQSAEAALLVAEEIDAQGNATGLDLTRQRVNAISALAAAQDADQAAENARIRLEVQIAGSADLPIRLPSPSDSLQTIQDIQVRVLESNLLLAAARHDVQAAANDAGIANIESLLHGELGVALDIEDGDIERGVSAHFEIPTNGFGHPQRAAAQIRAQQVLDRLTALETEITGEIEMHVLEMNRASERVALIEDEWLPASTLALEQTLEQYNAMQIGVYALLDAFNAQVEAGRAYIDTLERYHRARIALNALIQGGSPVGMTSPQGLNAERAGGEDH